MGNVITGGSTDSCKEESGADTGEEGAVEEEYESDSGDWQMVKGMVKVNLDLKI